MVIIDNPEDYKIIGYKIASDNKHKYIAILQNKHTYNIKHVGFGAIGYQQYHDKLGYYASDDHLDSKRRISYKKRHQGEENNKYSSGWFSWHYLW